MDKIEAQIREADEASRVLNAPVFAQAFEDLRLTYIRALEIIPTTADGDDQAKDVRRKLAVLSDIRSALTKRIDTGKLASHELSMREKASNAMRRFAKPLSNATGVR